MGLLNVKVTPGARADAVIGWQRDVLLVRVRARAERGKANEAVCRLIARSLGVPARSVVVTRGLSNRDKVLDIHGLNAAELRRRFDGSFS